MLRLFFPKMRDKISTHKNQEENRAILVTYFNSNVVLWMCWSLIFMIYVNYKELYVVSNVNTVDVVIASILHYLFLMQTVFAITVSKVLSLSEEQADAFCKAIRGEKYKDPP